MESDYITCSCLGTIASNIRTSKQKNDLFMASFSLNVATHNEKITAKLFDLTEDSLKDFTKDFTFGDRIKITGEVKCDAFISKDRIVKGICIIPTEIQLVEKSNIVKKEKVKIVK